MKIICIILLLIPLQAVSQDKMGFERILLTLEPAVSNLPLNIYTAHKRFPETFNNSKFDSLKNTLELEYQLLAKEGELKSYLLNTYANQLRGSQGRQYFEPVNVEMAALFTEGLSKFEEINNKYMGHFSTRYKGKYANGNYLLIWDSIYQARRPWLQQYVEALLLQVKKEAVYLQATKHMLTSKTEAERIQHLEAQAHVLIKLQSVIGIMKRVVVEEGGSRLLVCQEAPEVCGQKSSKSKQ